VNHTRKRTLGGSYGRIELAFVEREATPRLLMKLSIQLYPAYLFFLYNIYFIDIFDVSRVRSTVHN
jgi:hypothetical protein